MSSELIPYNDIEKMAAVTAKSGLFGIKTPEQAAALMLIAQAEGLHPAIAARDYHIIQGKPSLKADAMLARFQAAGGQVKFEEYTDYRVCAVFTHPQGGSIKIEWTLERAKQAGLATKETWRQYPRQMLRARVISEGIRTIFPGCIGGFYTPEEVMDITNKPDEAEEMPQSAAIETQAPDFHSIVNALNEAGDLQSLRKAWESLQPQIKLLAPAEKMELQKLKNQLKAKLQAGVEL